MGFLLVRGVEPVMEPIRQIRSCAASSGMGSASKQHDFVHKPASFVEENSILEICFY
jgi:hypothetical protein